VQEKPYGAYRETLANIADKKLIINFLKTLIITNER
jgi:hypothetical protein